MTKKLSRGLKVMAEWVMLISFVAFIAFLLVALKISNGELIIFSGISAMICIVTSLLLTIDTH